MALTPAKPKLLPDLLSSSKAVGGSVCSEQRLTTKNYLFERLKTAFCGIQLNIILMSAKNKTFKLSLQISNTTIAALQWSVTSNVDQHEYQFSFEVTSNILNIIFRVVTILLGIAMTLSNSFNVSTGS